MSKKKTDESELLGMLMAHVDEGCRDCTQALKHAIRLLKQSRRKKVAVKK